VSSLTSAPLSFRPLCGGYDIARVSGIYGVGQWLGLDPSVSFGCASRFEVGGLFDALVVYCVVFRSLFI